MPVQTVLARLGDGYAALINERVLLPGLDGLAACCDQGEED